MDLQPLLALNLDEAATRTDPANGAVWSFQRHAAGFVMTSPPFEHDAHDDLSFLLGCLLDNGSGNMPQSARFVAVGHTSVHLEWLCAPDQLQAAWQDAHTAYTQIQEGLAQHGQQSSQDAATDSAGDDALTAEQNALFALLNGLVVQSPELMAVYEFQPEQGLAVLESDDGNWMACVRPSAYPDQLAFVFPLAVLEVEAQQAAAQCMQVLQWNSVLSLGSEVTIACLSDGQTLVLKAEFNPHHADVQDVLALLGKLTVMEEELQQWLDDAQERSAPSQSMQASADNMALMMSGMLA